MKAHYILIAVAALVVSAACTKTNEQPEPEGIQMTFRAYQEGAQETKTTVQDGGTQVYWEPADEIKVFFKSSSGRFVSQNSELADVADFSGTLNILVGANEGAGSSNQTWGLYPYRADATYDGEYVTTTLPASQMGRSGSFAKNTHICLARSGGNDLAFYNVTGGLRFSLTQEGIKSVTFEGNNGESLAGKIKLAFEGGVPAIKEVSEGETTLTLTASGDGTFQTGKWYYIEVIPGTLSKGFKMVFSKGNETAKISSSSSVTINRGRYGSLADADEGLLFKENGGDEPDPSSVIQFADPVAKYACVEKYDTDHDGEVSYAEAAAATNLEGLFTNWNTVTSFDEIKYFTGVTSTQNVFNGCSKLKSITIPEFITTLGSFQNCSSLKSVVLPDAVISLPAYCFNGCSSLTNVDLPSGITSIPDCCFRNCQTISTVVLPKSVSYIAPGAFSECSSLSSIELPSSLTSIGDSAFEGCSCIRSIDFPATLTSIGGYAFDRCASLGSVSLASGVSIGQYAFSGCSFLASVVLPADMTAIPSGLFHNCTALRTITWPSALESIGGNAFIGCRFEENYYTLELPESVTSIHSGALCGIKHVILPSKSFITIDENAISEKYTSIYVPSNMVEMYKTRTTWSSYADVIFPIELYPISIYTPEKVDLGLPSGIQWASFNVGATSPEEYGDYFAWGEVSSKQVFSWSSYKWTVGSSSSNFTKYNPRSNRGVVDNLDVLELEDDAAYMCIDRNWRTPTHQEVQELFNPAYCEYKWAEIKGIGGYSIISIKNGNQIFLPAGGYFDNSSIIDKGTYGYYWTSTLCPWDPQDTEYSYYFYFTNDYSVWDCAARRRYGFLIRPVCPKD